MGSAIIHDSLDTDHLTKADTLDDLWYDESKLRFWAKGKGARLYFRNGILAEKDEYIGIARNHRGGLSATPSVLDYEPIVSLEDELKYALVRYKGDTVAVRKLEEIDVSDYVQRRPPKGPRDPRER
jgi:hypothetical protein